MVLNMLTKSEILTFWRHVPIYSRLNVQISHSWITVNNPIYSWINSKITDPILTHCLSPQAWTQTLDSAHDYTDGENQPTILCFLQLLRQCSWLQVKHHPIMYFQCETNLVMSALFFYIIHLIPNYYFLPFKLISIY